MAQWEEGGGCPCEGCDGTIELAYPDEMSCSCHLSAPCSRCTSSFLRCNSCGEEEPEDENKYNNDFAYRYIGTGIHELYCRNPSKDLGGGKRIYDYDYNSESGSSMVWEGKYEGPVTPQDIIDVFGKGTFGQSGPFLGSGRFTYTLLTD